VLKSVPGETTRLAALKGGEVDGIYWIAGQLAEELQRSPGLTLAVSHTAPFWVYFPEQWDPKSPWSDVRVRRAASLAIDRKGINDAITFGHSRLNGNSFVPPHFEFYWQPPAPVFDIAEAKRLLAEAGHAGGLDAGSLYCDAAFPNIGEAIVNSMLAAGIRARLQPIERAAFYKGYSERKFKGLILSGSAAFGNAATRLEALSSRAAPTPTAATLISTRCSRSGRLSSTMPSARRYCTGCSSLCMKRSSPRHFGNWPR
jgi:peptide/nickel transport system substrate-binding protein